MTFFLVEFEAMIGLGARAVIGRHSRDAPLSAAAWQEPP